MKVISTSVTVREVPDAALVSFPTPGRLADPDLKEWEYTYFLPSIPLRFQPRTESGTASIAPFGDVWVSGAGVFTPIPKPTPVYGVGLIHALSHVQGKPLTLAQILELIADIAEIIRIIHDAIVKRHPGHFPSIWQSPPKKKKGRTT